MRIRIPASVSRRAARSVLVGRKHSPAILFGVGVVGMVATTVTACKATLKLEDIIDEAQKNMELARTLESKDYSEEDRAKDKYYIVVQTTVKIGKLYGPSIVLGALSIAALAGSHNIMRNRNAGLTAAYLAVDGAFKKYRERVVAEYGEDKDREFRHGTEVETITVEDTNGPKNREIKRYAGASQYARMFNSSNKNWDRHPEYNAMFLRGQQKWANDRLRMKGHMMLNEVYELLGFDHTPAGTQVGWLWKRGTGDSYIDFGIFSDANAMKFHEFLVGQEGELLVDFNVDGPIWKQI